METPEDEELETRFIELETKLMYQDKMLDELNRVVTSHTTTLDELMLRIRRLEETLRAALDVDGKPPNEPPPHY